MGRDTRVQGGDMKTCKDCKYCDTYQGEQVCWIATSDNPADEIVFLDSRDFKPCEYFEEEET